VEAGAIDKEDPDLFKSMGNADEARRQIRTFYEAASIPAQD
jgi:hypothetical protein